MRALVVIILFMSFSSYAQRVKENVKQQTGIQSSVKIPDTPVPLKQKSKHRK